MFREYKNEVKPAPKRGRQMQRGNQPENLEHTVEDPRYLVEGRQTSVERDHWLKVQKVDGAMLEAHALVEQATGILKAVQVEAKNLHLAVDRSIHDLKGVERMISHELSPVPSQSTRRLTLDSLNKPHATDHHQIWRRANAEEWRKPVVRPSLPVVDIYETAETIRSRPSLPVVDKMYGTPDGIRSRPSLPLVDFAAMTDPWSSFGKSAMGQCRSILGSPQAVVRAVATATPTIHPSIAPAIPHVPSMASFARPGVAPKLQLLQLPSGAFLGMCKPKLGVGFRKN